MLILVLSVHTNILYGCNSYKRLDWFLFDLIWFSFTCMCSREQLAASILQEGSAGCRVVQKFLKILQVVVQEPGQAFKPFLPSILSLCMEQVYPIVAEVSWFISHPVSTSSRMFGLVCIHIRWLVCGMIWCQAQDLTELQNKMQELFFCLLSLVKEISQWKQRNFFLPVKCQVHE